MQFWFHHYTRMSGIISENLESKQFPFFQILTNNHSRDNFHFSILVKLFPTQHLPALALVGFLARQVLFRGSQLPQWLETEYLSPLFKPDFSSWKQSICLLFSNQISTAGNRVFVSPIQTRFLGLETEYLSPAIYKFYAFNPNIPLQRSQIAFLKVPCAICRIGIRRSLIWPCHAAMGTGQANPLHPVH